MKKFLIFALLMGALAACGPQEMKPDPHLELGQRITFVGGSPDKAYVIIGYRDEPEGTTTHIYHGQEYVVFIYVNDLHDIKHAAIHKNSILKM